MYVSCKTLFVRELSSFAHLPKFSLYYFNVIYMPWYDKKYGPKFFKKSTGLLVEDSLKLISVLSITNFGLLLISSKEEDRKVGESMKTEWYGYRSQQSNRWVFFFLESAYFYFTSCLVLKLVLSQVEVFRYFYDLSLCDYDFL